MNVMMMSAVKGEQLRLFLQLQVLPAVSVVRTHLLRVRITHVTQVFHQLLDGESFSLCL